jgi:hypothetical protein
MNDPLRKDNEGRLFINDRARTKASPVRKGYAWVEGKRYWVSSWEKTAESGDKYWTLAFEPDTRED